MSTSYADVYSLLYGTLYGVPFPQAPLDVQASLLLGGSWTDITTDVYNRQQPSPAMTITRGRPDETTTASPGTLAGQVNNRAGKYSPRNPNGPYYGQIGRNTPIRVSVPSQASYLRMEDDTVSYAAMPAAGVLTVNSQDIRLDLTLTSWLPCCLASWWGSGQRAWAVLLNGDGTITFALSTDGTDVTVTATSTMPLPLVPGCLRVTWDWVPGTTTFYTAPPGGVPGSSWTQLGQAVFSGSTATPLWTSTAALGIGYNSAAAADFGVTGPAGQVREASARSGIGGTVLCDPVFTAQFPGATSFADGQGNTWTLHGTSEISRRSYRCHMEMAALASSQDAAGKDVWLPLQGSGQLRRAAAGNNPLPSPFRRAVLSLTGADKPVAYWPCEDAGGTRAGFLGPGALASAIGGPPMAITGTPSLAADSSFLCSDPLPQINASRWAGPVPQYQGGTGTIVLRGLLKVDSGFPAASEAVIAAIVTTGSQPFLYLAYTTIAGQANLVLLIHSPLTLLSTVALPAGETVLMSAELTTSGGTITGLVRYMDTNLNIATGTTPNTYSGITGHCSQVIAGAWLDDPGIWTHPHSTALGHLYVQTAVQPLLGPSGMSDALIAHQGETAANRFARICAENGYRAKIYGYPAVSAAMGPQPAGTLQAVLQECEAADRGLIYEPRESLALAYRTLSSLLSQPPAVVLDYAQGHLGQAGQPGEWQPVDDDQHTVNDAIVQRGSPAVQGSTFTFALNDGSAMSVSPPPAGVGDYQSSYTCNLDSDAQLPDTAGWIVNVGTVNQERNPSVPLNLSRPALASPFYAVQEVTGFGDHVQIANPPVPQLPPDTVKQLVYGIREQLGGMLWLIDWQCVPEQPYEVLVLDDPLHSLLDTDGSVLHAAVASGATTILVDTVNVVSPLWTTSAGDFPFDVVAGGEQMTVTNITGSSSPQAFTVTRSVNGVVKAHAAGEAVSLYAPVVLAVA